MAAPVEIEDANWHRSKQLNKECGWKRGDSAMVKPRWGRRWRERRIDSKAGIHRKEEKKKNRLHTHRPSHGSCRLPSNWRRATIDPRTSNKKTNRSEPPLPSSTGISLILNASASSASRRRRDFVIFNLRDWEKICRSERIQTC